MHTIFGRSLGVFLTVGLLFVLSASPAISQSFRFSSISVEGADRTGAETVAAIAEVPTGAALSASELSAATGRLVASGFFEDVEVLPQGSTLVIRVVERPTINRINIEGNRRIDDAPLRAVIESQPRRIFDPAQAAADARAIADVYVDAGRLAATVRPAIIRRSGNRVDLAFEVEEGAVVEAERISFVGNNAFSDRRLRRVLESKQAGFLRQVIQADTFLAERIPFDRALLTDFYRARGYVDFRILDVSTEITRERDATFTTFNIFEGARYSVGSVSVVSEINDIDVARYAREVRVREGAVWSPVAVERTIRRLERLALREGRDFVRVNPDVERNPESRTLDVVFRIQRGPRVFVERIDIEGNVTTLDRVIRRQFDTVEGDPFNPREIRNAAERIRALGFFADATVDTREGSSSSQVIVDVDVEEQPTGSLSLGGSYSVDSGFGIIASFSERNFLGRGQTLSFQITTGLENADASISFVEPALLGRNLTFGFTAFYRTTDFDDAAFNTEVIGVEPSITFPLGEQTRLRLSYTISSDEISDVAADNSPILQREEGRRLTSAVGYRFTFDTRRTGLNPDAGILLSFGQEFAGVGGDTRYIRTSGRAVAQREFPQRELAFRAILEGAVLSSLGDDSSRVTDRFFNSPAKIRGFSSRGIGPRDLAAEDDDVLGGNFEAYARLEADFPLGLPDEYGLTGGVFLDLGSVWGLDDTAGAAEVDDGFALRAAAGVALFWSTPIGPLALNFAWPLVSEENDEEQFFNLAIQTTF